MTTKNKPNETHAEMIERLRGVLGKLRERFDAMPPGRGAGLFQQIQELERRIKREEIHALSGYRTPRHAVSGGAPGSNRRK